MIQTPSKAWNISLWILQLLLATTLIWAAYMKLTQSPETLSAMWPWAGAVSPALVKLTGLADLLAGLGLVLPSLLRIKPLLTPLAAIGIVVLMVCASVFHILRGEASQIGFNIGVAIMAAVIAWGRFRKVPVAPR